jgi:hypothetical protein
MELKLDAVGKRYSGDFWAVRDCTLDLAPGIVGLLAAQNEERLAEVADRALLRRWIRVSLRRQRRTAHVTERRIV